MNQPDQVVPAPADSSSPTVIEVSGTSSIDEVWQQLEAGLMRGVVEDVGPEDPDA